jgi:hypothetical protein
MLGNEIARPRHDSDRDDSGKPRPADHYAPQGGETTGLHMRSQYLRRPSAGFLTRFREAEAKLAGAMTGYTHKAAGPVAAGC